MVSSYELRRLRAVGVGLVSFEKRWRQQRDQQTSRIEIYDSDNGGDVSSKMAVFIGCRTSVNICEHEVVPRDRIELPTP
jgi:hypothetical protein